MKNDDRNRAEELADFTDFRAVWWQALDVTWMTRDERFPDEEQELAWRRHPQEVAS